MVGGPNGSGKTTLIRFLQQLLGQSAGHDLNPDRIEAEVLATGALDFHAFGFMPETTAIQDFVQTHPLSRQLSPVRFVALGSLLRIEEQTRSGYLAAILADFIRNQWVFRQQSFIFETVMSGADKIDFMRQSRDRGYRTYLYFVCTEDARVNIERVKSRVEQGGHNVPRDKIISRFIKSLENLPEAILTSDRAYIFDNSGSKHTLCAEFVDGRPIRSFETPAWFRDIEAQIRTDRN